MQSTTLDQAVAICSTFLQIVSVKYVAIDKFYFIFYFFGVLSRFCKGKVLKTCHFKCLCEPLNTLRYAVFLRAQLRTASLCTERCGQKPHLCSTPGHGPA